MSRTSDEDEEEGGMRVERENILTNNQPTSTDRMNPDDVNAEYIMAVIAYDGSTVVAVALEAVTFIYYSNHHSFLLFPPRIATENIGVAATRCMVASYA
jgi:hypothetical protein